MQSSNYSKREYAEVLLPITGCSSNWLTKIRQWRENKMTSLEQGANFDPAKSEAFAEKFVTALNYGALCLMASVGHRTGLFDVMSGLPPSTAVEIAEKSGLNERYVREWLGAMVTSGVVEVDSSSTRYVLPAEHAAFLTRAVAADNIAVFA
jgi:hypothetical protein